MTAHLTQLSPDYNHIFLKKLVISRACLKARETLKMQVFLSSSSFFLSCVLTRRGHGPRRSCMAETVETGDKNRDVTDDIFRAPYTCFVKKA